jgi:hypothetical protein
LPISRRTVSTGRQTLVKPGQRGGNFGVLVAQPIHQLNCESIAQRHLIGHRRWRRFRTQQPIGQQISLLAERAVRHLGFGEPAEVLDQHDAQGGGKRPQLADGQRLHLLVSPDIAAEYFWIETAIRVGDEGPGHAENARIEGERAVGQLGQLPVIAGRQIRADVVDLPLDQVVVVQQPQAGRRDCAALVRDKGDGGVRLQQRGRVVREPPGKRMPLDRRRGHGLGSGQAASMRLEALDTEQLLADDALSLPKRRAACAPEEEFQRRLFLDGRRRTGRLDPGLGAELTVTACV